MKSICVLLFLIALMTSEAARKIHEDCTMVMGGCAASCPKGQYRGYTACKDHNLPEPTCYNPSPLPVKNIVCNYSNLCYCLPPTVRDQETNRCVPLHKCGLASDSEE